MSGTQRTFGPAFSRLLSRVREGKVRIHLICAWDDGIPRGFDVLLSFLSCGLFQCSSSPCCCETGLGGSEPPGIVNGDVGTNNLLGWNKVHVVD